MELWEAPYLDKPDIIFDEVRFHAAPRLKSWFHTEWGAVAWERETKPSEEMEKLCDSELRRMQRYSVDLTLDPDTAHPYLILSEDGKQVSHGYVKKNLPNNKERFSLYASVLGKQGFSSGRFYYEVQVGGKTAWTIGVARESINRKGQIYSSPDNGW